MTRVRYRVGLNVLAAVINFGDRVALPVAALVFVRQPRRTP
ncbi:acetone carboxylase gamma subunit [Crossiella equi]|uniref:Acetone carboxylase gamma subunit n=1 Tax=Crossiella equi TaxID=130796 RepID=A0ABS5A745_9PSEU|nr:hypothetical protein [Crossiella equi]MBP2472052.1 acetone carboxylase gamma subunit [Crossiella equi]